MGQCPNNPTTCDCRDCTQKRASHQTLSQSQNPQVIWSDEPTYVAGAMGYQPITSEGSPSEAPSATSNFKQVVLPLSL